jgi:chromate reductase
VGVVVVEPACRRIPVPRSAVGPDGTVTDPELVRGLAEVWAELARYTRL